MLDLLIAHPLLASYAVLSLVGLVAMLAACRWSCAEYRGEDF